MHTVGSFFAEESDSRCDYMIRAGAFGVLFTFSATTGPLAPLGILGPREVPLEKIAAGPRVTEHLFARLDSGERG